VETDNGKRGSAGLVLSLVESKPGRLRLVVDDVKNKSGFDQGPWVHHVLYTFKDYETTKITKQEMSDVELAEIGSNLLARLGVLHNNPIP